MKKTTKQNNLIEGSAIMNRIIGFIKYHNAFTIGLILVFVFSGAIFASEDLHDAVIGEEITTQTGIDNAQLLATDLDALDLAMTIDAVSEDEENYYIDYSFNTLGIADNTWQPLIKRATMTVSKAALGDKDLGLYVAEELGEVADYELAYLLEVQTAEIEKGQTEIVETTEYTGLVGLVLDIKNKVLPGYESVVELVFDESVQIAQVSQPIDTNDEFLMMDYHSPEPEPELETTPVDPAPEIALVPDPEPVCDLENLNLCTNDLECAGAGGYWYNNVCNSEPLFKPEPEPEPVIPPDIPPTDTTTPPADGIADGGQTSPVADDQNITINEDTPVNITLTASDADDDFLTYLIVTQPTNGTLSGEDSSLIYTPNPDYNGQDAFTFKVNDGTADSNIATVTIIINSVNDSPIANAGQDQTIEDTDGDGQEIVTLDGSASSDPDGEVVSFQWQEGENILGDTAQITYDFLVGEHTIILTVADNQGATATDEVIIIVNPKSNQTPVANLTADRTEINVGDTVNFDGSASYDSDGSITSYQWDFGKGITDTGSTATHSYSTAGTYTVTLTVTDNGGQTATSTLLITVKETV